VTAPEYGGIFNVAGWGMPAHTDTWWHHDGGYVINDVSEKLSMGDWGLDRDVYHWASEFVPWNLAKPHLLESWTQPDPLTIVMKVRQGVNWHDKAPMNGRAFTAKDIEYNLHRYFAMGSGFTEMSAYVVGRVPSLVSITATDDSTVVIKLGEPQVDVVDKIMWGYMYPPEVIEQDGDAKDWKNLVGTGPFELADVVPGSSETYVKNPNYWGYDEKYPENRLPYVDEIKSLVMPEEATRVAAMRTGKIDVLGMIFGGGWTQLFSVDPAVSLMRTNPELQYEPMWAFSNTSFAVNTQAPPFDDVRVRHALQMAINLDEINRVFHSSYADTTPQTYLSSSFVGYVVPFEDWPEELKGYYTYDPAGAEALLDAVGLKRGADGTRFETTLIMRQTSGSVVDHAFVVKPYWEAIGIDVTIKSMDRDIWLDTVYKTRDWEGITTWQGGVTTSAVGQMKDMSVNQSPARSVWNVNDPALDAMYEAVRDAASDEEQMRLSKEASLYIAEQHWNIWGAMAPQFSAVQPWIVGYNGEAAMVVDARIWIDSQLKEAMGH
jgi:peptide/nickel transport system substrate-binding protein